MLYSAMTYDELERLVYVEPSNIEAARTLMRFTEQERDTELEELRDEVAALTERNDELQEELDELQTEAA